MPTTKLVVPQPEMFDFELDVMISPTGDPSFRDNIATLSVSPTSETDCPCGITSQSGGIQPDAAGPICC